MGVSFPDRRPELLATILAVVVAALWLPATAQALEGIAVIDYQLIFDRYEGTADAQRTLDRELKEWENEAKALRDEITELTQELESQRLMLSEERLREKEDALAAKKEQYEAFAESIFGINGEAAKRNAELTRPIAEKIMEVIARIGEEENLKLILDASTGGVVWAEDDVNLTQIVLDDLSSAFEEEEAAAEGEADEATAGESESAGDAEAAGGAGE
jgi:Skp family chaperone for outer membrane proteins